MTTIWHHSERNARLIADRRLDGTATWPEAFDGTPAEAAEYIRDFYGRPVRLDDNGRRFCYVGFALTITE